MDFALIGVEPSTLQIVRSAASAGDRLCWIDDPSPTADQLRELAPDAASGRAWEELLDVSGGARPVVIGAGESELRAEQLRKLIQAGVPVLVAQPVLRSMVIYYELEMIRRDSGSVLRHYVPGRDHPLLSYAAGAISGEEDSLGDVQQILFDRRIGLGDADAIQDELIRDIGLIQQLVGPIGRVTALGASGQRTDDLSSVEGVQFASTAGRTVRWNRLPPDPAPGARLTIFGSAGKVEIEMPASGPWRMKPVSDGAEGEAPDSTAPNADGCWRDFVAAIAKGDDGRDWEAATHSLSHRDPCAALLGPGLHLDQLDLQLGDALFIGFARHPFGMRIGSRP